MAIKIDYMIILSGLKMRFFVGTKTKFGNFISTIKTYLIKNK